jgi:hypothetical protein
MLWKLQCAILSHYTVLLQCTVLLHCKYFHTQCWSSQSINIVNNQFAVPRTLNRFINVGPYAVGFSRLAYILLDPLFLTFLSVSFTEFRWLMPCYCLPLPLAASYGHRLWPASVSGDKESWRRLQYIPPNFRVYMQGRTALQSRKPAPVTGTCRSFTFTIDSQGVVLRNKPSRATKLHLITRY